MKEVELTQRYADLADAVEQRLGDSASRLANGAGEITYQVSASKLLECCRTLRDDVTLKFEMLMDLCGVDYYSYGKDEWQTEGASGTGFSRGRSVAPASAVQQQDFSAAQYLAPSRFAVVYHLLSITHNHRLRLKVFCDDDSAPVLDSVMPIWASADWYEREAFDLFGILFRGHPDLRRLLTDYGFIGHPFRKDFPLVGNVEMRYDPARGRVVYEPVSIEPRTLVAKVIRDDNRYREDLKDSDDA